MTWPINDENIKLFDENLNDINSIYDAMIDNINMPINRIK